MKAVQTPRPTGCPRHAKRPAPSEAAEIAGIMGGAMGVPGADVLKTSRCTDSMCEQRD